MELDEALRRYPGAATFKFGDGPELCAALLELVRTGRKTATCGALREFEEEGEAMPAVGRRDIALNWDGTPALVIETESVALERYCDVGESFALAEGENDSLAGWREDHRDYFTRNGGFDPEMMLVCERFRLVEDFARTSTEDRKRDVQLREITADTVREVTKLAVRPDQQVFVASNAVSLAEALFTDEAWYRAVYLGDEPVGFVMLYDESLRPSPPAAPDIALWRFMVCADFQGRGIGAAALQQVIAHVRSKGVFASLLVSYVPGPGCPEGFYLGAGFEHTGQMDEDEVILKLVL